MKIVLNFIDINNKNELFDLLNSKFNFNEKCTNLDALYDELTSITENLEIIIQNFDQYNSKIGNYLKILKQLFDDCEEECENIHILYE